MISLQIHIDVWGKDYQKSFRADGGTTQSLLTHWGRDTIDAILQTTFSNAISWMKMLEFRLKFHWSLFLKGPINNTPALGQIMAWRRPGEKPLSEPMMVILLTHICVTRPQWVKLILLMHNSSFYIKIIFWGMRILIRKIRWSWDQVESYVWFSSAFGSCTYPPFFHWFIFRVIGRFWCQKLVPTAWLSNYIAPIVFCGM